MWRFNPFGGKEQTGLEGRTIDVGNVKVTVRNAIAEGGFSCVYLARDAVHVSKHYALKHLVCNDSESLDLVMKEIQVMNLLKDHPNVVTLIAHNVYDMGRTKEALLVMEFCNKSLVSALESRGSGYYEEKHALLIFRDICNAVFVMHGQSPPIAHRDLKAENVLLGSDGAWKLCDFGSTSTNHKCFDRPEEMGIEEDIIRKHTTPAYRAPEMWDLYRREVISEKVDIWALGCLLYRICYFRSAFDGDSKLQILNGNYRIPELPKYSTALTGLVKDMLEASPNARPDITQVWFRVNELLPSELQKSLPDGAPSSIFMQPQPSISQDEGAHKRTPVMPRRSPPPPPKESIRYSPPSHATAKTGDGPIGAFWATKHAQDSKVVDNRNPLFDEEPIKLSSSSEQNQGWVDISNTSAGDRYGHSVHPIRRSAQSNSTSNNSLTGGSDINLFMESQHLFMKTKASQPESKSTFQNDTFNNFVADFDANKPHYGTTGAAKTTDLEAELATLKDQLKKTNLEKAEMMAKFEKLSAICRSQHQEIQELKRNLAEATPPASNKQQEKLEGTVWELQQGLLAQAKPWQAFPDLKTRTTPQNDHATNGRQNLTKQTNMGHSPDMWGFGPSFKTSSTGTATQTNRTTMQGSSSQRFSTGATKKVEQPVGWAGF